jgi:hypothetical protein
MSVEASSVNRELQFEIPNQPEDMFDALKEELRLAYKNQYLFQTSISGLYGIWGNSTYIAWASQYVETYIDYSAETAENPVKDSQELSKRYLGMLDGCLIGLHASMQILPESAQRDIYHSWPTDILYQQVDESDEVYVHRRNAFMRELDWELADDFEGLEPRHRQIIIEAGALYDDEPYEEASHDDEPTAFERSSFIRGIQLSRSVICEFLMQQREDLEAENA